ncbi:MAG: hypothetical protein WCC69_06580 [Pirellulales bacterium]
MHHRAVTLRFAAWIGFLTTLIAAWGLPRHVEAVPTPRMSEAEMLAACDVAVEGEVVAVTLVKRSVGNRQGIDLGYEQGVFACTLKADKLLKGESDDDGTIRYVVDAYMEGSWADATPRRFVYEGTQAAVTPGSRIRAFLKRDPEKGDYRRVHFNSGFDVVRASDAAFPMNEGETAVARKSDRSGCDD